MSVLTSLGHIIPPPSFMTLPSVGVDISDTSIKYLDLTRDRRSGHSLRLGKWGNLDVPEGTLKRGNIEDPKAIADRLREIKKRTGSSNVRIALPEERAYLFETEIARGTSFKEIRGQLEFRLEENVPLSPRDAFFDFDSHMLVCWRFFPPQSRQNNASPPRTFRFLIFDFRL